MGGPCESWRVALFIHPNVMKFAVLLGLLFQWIYLAPAHSSEPGDCEASLRAKRYIQSDHIYKFRPSVSLGPEARSLEKQFPGLSQALSSAHDMLAGATAITSELSLELQRHFLKLTAVAGQTQSDLIGNMYSFLKSTLKYGADLWHPEALSREELGLREVNWMRSNIWTALVAAHFDATEILFNRYFEQLYPDRYSSFMASREARGSGRGRFHFNPEIDIVIHRPDGQSYWFEIKDWSRGYADRDRSVEIVREQCAKLNRARDLIHKGRPKTFLVLKHGDLPASRLRQYLSAGCDEVIFMFPTR